MLYVCVKPWCISCHKSITFFKINLSEYVCKKSTTIQTSKTTRLINLLVITKQNTPPVHNQIINSQQNNQHTKQNTRKALLSPASGLSSAREKQSKDKVEQLGCNSNYYGSFKPLCAWSGFVSWCWWRVVSTGREGMQ